VSEDAYAALGLGSDADWDEVRDARRRLAKALHPDLQDQSRRAEAERRMAAVNRAFDELSAARQEAPVEGREAVVVEGAARFTVPAPPVSAFDAVLMAAVELGDVVQVDPPSLLAVLLDDPGPCHCMVELAPAGAGSVVSVDIGPRAYGRCPSLAAVRDALAAETERQVALG
jgi:predicted secreted protein